MKYTSAITRTFVLCFLLNGTILAADSDTAYNDYSTNLLEVRLPMVKVGPPESFFGFSVAEHRVVFSSEEGRTKPSGATESVLLVGAPIYDGQEEGNVERPGDVFRCPYTTLSEDCDSLNIDVTDSTSQENKTDQWLGVNVRSQGPAGQIVVCAHRYRVEQSTDSMQWALGKCYVIKQNVYNLDFVESPSLRNEWIMCDNEDMSLNGFGYCQSGTGLGLSVFKDKKGERKRYMYMAIGAPGSSDFCGTTFVRDISDEGADDYYPKTQTTFENVKPSSYSGFSITVGKLNSIETDTSDPNFVVSGAPRRNDSGMVTILTHENSRNILQDHQDLNGMNITESFGFATVVIDINGDSFDDVVVGAPMHYDRKALIGGRIYIFLNDGSPDTYFGKATRGKYDQYIDGPLDSMFGMAMANLGDMNGDEAQELVVGAPYENFGEGAVYIYMGNKDGRLGEPIQKITPQTLNKDLKGVPLPNMTFGYSLSAGMDMDDNKFPDLLIGAFESNSVILLRSRPIVQPQYEIITDPKNLTANTFDCPVEGINKQCMTITLHLIYYCAALYDDILKMDLLLEADVERLEKDLSSRVSFRNTTSHTIKTTVDFLEQETWYLTKEYILIFEKPPEDIYSPVVIRATLSLPKVNATMPEPGQDVPSLNPFPILDPNTVATQVIAINFTKKCDQDDGKCETDLRLNASLVLPIGPDGIPVFTYGQQSSIKLELKLNVDNLGEDAYEAKVFIEVSDVLMYDKDSSNICEEDPENPSRVICKLGNPFEEKDQKMTTISFTTGEIQANQGSLDFNITATTTTTETYPIDNSKFLSAQVESETDLKLSVIGDKSQYEYGGEVRGECAMENVEMIGTFVQHNWTVVNVGPGIVPEVLVTITFPYETASGKWLLYLTEMPILIGASSSYCVLPDNSIDVLNLTYPRGKDEDENVKTCFPRNNRRKRRDVEGDVLPTPQAQSDKKPFILECNSKNPTANCILIKCYFSDVQNGEKNKIVINSRLWNSTFLEDYINEDDIQIDVWGVVEISNGSYIKQRDKSNDQAGLRMQVHRDFSILTSPPPLKWWIILLAVIGGLLVLILIILCLWKVGFFERHGKSACGFFERKTMNYQYATVEQKSSGRKGKKDKTYMADDIHYTGGYE